MNQHLLGVDDFGERAEIEALLERSESFLAVTRRDIPKVPALRGKTVVSLDQFGCLCSTMFRISPNHLLWALESLVDGEVVNEIVVPDEQAKWAKIALDRMLQIR